MIVSFSHDSFNPHPWKQKSFSFHSYPHPDYCSTLLNDPYIHWREPKGNFLTRPQRCPIKMLSTWISLNKLLFVALINAASHDTALIATGFHTLPNSVLSANGYPMAANATWALVTKTSECDWGRRSHLPETPFRKQQLFVAPTPYPVERQAWTTKLTIDEKSFDHGNYRTGRRLPGRTPDCQRVYGAWTETTLFPY